MSVRLTLICHAATSAVPALSFPLDEPLDPRSRADAEALAPELRGVAAALTSPALRARQTARALGLDAVVDPGLRDIDVGHWAGRSLDAVATEWPDAVAAWTRDVHAAPHGGESVADLLGRVAPWLEARRSERGHIAAITHPFVIRAVVVLAIDATPASFWRIDVAPLCRAEITGQTGKWTLRALFHPRGTPRTPPCGPDASATAADGSR